MATNAEEKTTTTTVDDQNHDNTKKEQVHETNVQLTNDIEAKQGQTDTSAVSGQTTHTDQQVSSDSSADNQNDSSPASDDTKKEESKLSAGNSHANETDKFQIEKGNGEHLTDFQRQKAKYFFHVNLDIENKEYVTWEDVEFYLLFHATAAGKEGSNGGDLEARLSRATRAFWEYIHDQIPLEGDDRNRLTLDQFLDTWASLIDYVIRANRLPPLVDDLVKLGFELYASNESDGKTLAIEPTAFDQLFQKMNLGRTFAIMAYKILTENGTNPLDLDKVESMVRAVITSSDDEHPSHFLLPGFFKTIKEQRHASDQDSSDSDTKSAPPSPSPSVESEKRNPSSKEPPQRQQSYEQSSSEPRRSFSPSISPKQATSPTPKDPNVSTSSVPNQQQQQQQIQSAVPRATREIIQQEDENIRRLLRYYHIDDGDIVEVAGGSVERVVLVHPERPLPAYIQQDKALLQKIQAGPNLSLTSSQENKPKITLEQRVSRGEAQTGPSIPFRPEQKQGGPTNVNARQVYPPMNASQQAQQQEQARLQATASPNVKSNNVAHNQQEPSEEEEKRLVGAVLQQLRPLIQKRVVEEVRRIQTGETDEDDDDEGGFIPFPFMFGGGPMFGGAFAGPPPTQSSGRQQQQQQSAPGADQPQGNRTANIDFDGLPPGAGFIPPNFLMAMMNDLARASAAGEMPGFPSNESGPSQGPIGVEGFMMFVDGTPMMGGGPAGPFPPQHGQPRFP